MGSVFGSPVKSKFGRPGKESVINGEARQGEMGREEGRGTEREGGEREGRRNEGGKKKRR